MLVTLLRLVGVPPTYGGREQLPRILEIKFQATLRRRRNFLGRQDRSSGHNSKKSLSNVTF